MWEVALTECHYVPSDVILKKGDLIGTFLYKTPNTTLPVSFSPIGTNKFRVPEGIMSEFIAEEDISNIDDLFTILNEVTGCKFSASKSNRVVIIDSENKFPKRAEIKLSTKIKQILGLHDVNIRKQLTKKKVPYANWERKS
jgi:hypothetical protein